MLGKHRVIRASAINTINSGITLHPTLPVEAARANPEAFLAN